MDRPWRSSFLGYTVTLDRQPRLKPAPDSVKRLKGKLRDGFRKGRGHKLQKVIEDMNPQLRGWITYYRLSETREVFEGLDSWIRRRFRCMIWRQWKRSRTRLKKLRSRGLEEKRAKKVCF